LTDNSGDARDNPSGIRNVGGAKLNLAFIRTKNLAGDAKEDGSTDDDREAENTDAGSGLLL
jgi:hypothetical protein